MLKLVGNIVTQRSRKNLDIGIQSGNIITPGRLWEHGRNPYGDVRAICHFRHEWNSPWETSIATVSSSGNKFSNRNYHIAINSYV